MLKVSDIVEIRTAHIMYKADSKLLPVNIHMMLTLYSPKLSNFI